MTCMYKRNRTRCHSALTNGLGGIGRRAQCIRCLNYRFYAAENMLCARQPLGLCLWLAPERSSMLVPAWRPSMLRQRAPGISQRDRGFGRKTVGPVRAVLSGERAARAGAKKPVQVNVKAIVTIRRKRKEDLRETFERHLDSLIDGIGRNVLLQLVSVRLDPGTKDGKKSKESALKGWLEKSTIQADKVEYAADFTITSDFGEPGAILVTNQHKKEFYLESIVLEGFIDGPICFPCNSWVHPATDNSDKRIFFSNKPRLPSQTPDGIKVLRQKELEDLRGNGKGIRKHSDRIYDYATYNDIGNPDKSKDLARPVLGGDEIPYPRRCRTGRLPTKTDPSTESGVEKHNSVYVPRDETFEESKQNTFSTGALRALLHGLIPSLMASLSHSNKDFRCFSEIDRLYREGLVFQFELGNELLKNMPFPKIVNKIQESSAGLLRYDTPSIISRDRFAWLRDDEFARQTLAGVNPVNLERLKVFPPVSNLDPAIYGPPESAIKKEHIIGQLNGMSIEQALQENRLFILDYHDVFLPFVKQINALDGRKTYATRTIFFLNSLNTLKPIAIELSLPLPSPGCESKRVFTPASDATTYWLWQLAKAHVCTNDAGIHQLVNHWLRTHACMENYIIAAHRHLSFMHPIFKLLQPHMRYTMEMNALARQSLINAGGIIESCFTPGPYCMELSAAAYRTQWRFDMEALPADLVRRGMAVEDPTKPHGIRLVIEDYPYAADGLLIWSAIKEWVDYYIHCYYSEPNTIQNDAELQAWWDEIKNKGHYDKRNETWWPKLKTKEDLVSILTTMIWVGSAQHAALNFGQYPYGGYVLNRPCLMRRLIPEEKDPEYRNFVSDPQTFFLLSVPTLLQAINTMAVVDTLSTHSPDEEYLGQRHQSMWTNDLQVVDAFHKFSATIQDIEKIINQRNGDLNLRNRHGAGVIPYELLLATSGPGMTGRGIPNSVSI